MSSPVAPPGPFALLSVTVRRGLTMGRYFFLFGLGYCVIFGAVLNISAPRSFGSIYPELLPIFVVVGSLGGIVVFTNDRLKGVLEYLMAYGFRPRQLFVNFLLAGLLLATIVLGISLGFGLGLNVAIVGPPRLSTVELIVEYALPMSYASVAFAAIVGMYWTALSSPRAGMSSPLGLVPLLGIAPSLFALLAEAFFPSDTHEVLLVVVLAVVVLVIVLIRLIDLLLRRERLLSPT